jgi:glutamate synthase (NADPH/NADH) large chain
VLKRGHEALCAVPHRGGMSAEGVGDGAGISVDLSLSFFRGLTGDPDLALGRFGVGNFFLPNDQSQHQRAADIIESAFAEQGFPVLLIRDVPIDDSAIRPAAIRHQLPIRQWIFAAPETTKTLAEFDWRIHKALLAIEAVAYTDPTLAGFYPLSLSARTQVFKGRLNSNEVLPYFRDLVNPAHEIHTMYFHTRFSTNTDPHPSMAQPFRLMAHNGELNTDKKNRLSEAAIALARNSAIIRPKGQSDSCRLDQTLQSRVMEEGLDLVTAVVSMMPPAWENDDTLSEDVRAMFEYFSLYEEKNDGPAALIFGNGPSSAQGSTVSACGRCAPSRQRTISASCRRPARSPSRRKACSAAAGSKRAACSTTTTQPDAPLGQAKRWKCWRRSAITRRY